jgi:hypothetical protein
MRAGLENQKRTEALLTFLCILGSIASTSNFSTGSTWLGTSEIAMNKLKTHVSYALSMHIYTLRH